MSSGGARQGTPQEGPRACSLIGQLMLLAMTAASGSAFKQKCIVRNKTGPSFIHASEQLYDPSPAYATRCGGLSVMKHAKGKRGATNADRRAQARSWRASLSNSPGARALDRHQAKAP